MDKEKLRQSAIGLLARREHSRAELFRKLRVKTDDTELLTEILDSLEESSLLSDQRFLESFTHYRQSQGYGPLRIRQELRDKGIDHSIISEFLDNQEECWLENASRVREKKFGQNAPNGRIEIAKQINFLIYRGFNIEQAQWACVKAFSI